MADYSLEQLKGAFSDALKTVFGGTSAGKPGTKTTGGGDGLANFIELAKASVPVITGFKGIGTQGGYAVTALEKLTSIVPVVGTAMTEAVGAIARNREQLNQMGQFGMGANNGAQMQAQLAGAGITGQQNIEIVRGMNGSMNSLAGNVDLGNQRFLKFSTELQQSPIPQTLKEFNVGTQEITKAGAIMVSGTKVNLEKDKAARTDLINASGELALQITKTAIATGKSRETIEGELQARLGSIDSQLAMQTMNEQQRQQYIKTQASLTGQGPTLQNLAETIASGGRLSPEDRKAMNALGPMAGQFQRAVLDMQKADTPEKKAAAEAQMKAVRAGISDMQNSPQYARMARQGGTEVSAMQRQLALENRERQGMAAEKREGGGTGVQALERTEKFAESRIQGKIPAGQPGAGQADPGQATNRVINQAIERSRINSAGAAENINRMNTAIGKIPKFAENAEKSISAVFGKERTQQGAADRNQATVDRAIKMAGGKTTSPVDETKAGAPGTRLRDKREHGTLGEIGQIAEPKDLIAMIHKNERVLSAKENKDLTGALSMVKNMKTPDFTKLPALPDVAKGMKASASTDVPEVKSTATTPPAPTGSSSQDAMLTAINQLNKTNALMLAEMQSINEHSGKTARIAGKASGNRALA